jgi:uracil-DNA glycosylase
MFSESIVSEFVSLLADTREQLAYLHELGVENIERQSPAGNSQKQAVAAELPQHQTHFSSDSLQSTLRSKAGDFPSGAAAAAAASKVSTREQQTSVFSGPSDTLFGDLGPSRPILQKSSESFEQIWADVGDCTRCPLYQRRTHIVHTEGNRQARLMFVGEAPGADEDAQARPFVGRAGQLLTKIIEAIGFKREEVLIGNVNRCRPPGNRPPTPEEASMCKPFLLREIAAVQPEVIVVLGNTAMRNLLDMKQGITKVRGQFQDYHGVKVMPTFHPAYLLRDPSKKQETWQDLKKVRDYLDATRKRDS